MKSPRGNRPRLPAAARRATACACLLLAAGTAARAQQPAAGAVRMRVWTATERRDILVTGRDGDTLLLAPGTAGGVARLRIDTIEQADFPVEYDRFAVARAVAGNDWPRAIAILSKAFAPYFPYLDLPGNSAAATVLDLGTYMMRVAARSARDAADDADRERARRQYEAACAVFRHCARVPFDNIGVLGRLKGCRCLVALGRTRAAELDIARLEPPEPGDPAYGHYWLVRAELAAATNGYALAMDAAVKSLCFESKDVETFPDALLCSARCYEELGEPCRARDVCFEVAKLFPRTDWAETAVRKLRAIMESGATRTPEAASVESVFFGLNEDINALAERLLEELKQPPPATMPAEEEEESAVRERQPADRQR